MRRTGLLIATLVAALVVLVACSDGANADEETIRACERWGSARDDVRQAAAEGELAVIAELATDRDVSQRVEQLRQALDLDFTGSLTATRVMRVDAACRDAVGTKAIP